MDTKQYVNCFLVKNGQVCLAMKKRGFGVNLWNGSGGKLKPNESSQDAAKREVKEELGVDLTEFEKHGEIVFFLRKEDKKVLCDVFLAHKWVGIPKETEEMSPNWFDISQIPYNSMWKSDKLWLPKILEGKKIKARFDYTCEGGALTNSKITEVNHF